MGKARPKNGLESCVCHLANAIGVVTIDADGQHLRRGLLEVANVLENHPIVSSMGVRALDKNVRYETASETASQASVSVAGGAAGDRHPAGFEAIPRSFIQHC